MVSVAFALVGQEDRGLAGSLAWNPPPSTGRGPKLTLTQTIGAVASGGKEALLSRTTLWRSAVSICVRATALRARRRSASNSRRARIRLVARLQPGLALDPRRVRSRVAGVFARGAPARERERRCGPGARGRLPGRRAVVGGVGAARSRVTFQSTLATMWTSALSLVPGNSGDGLRWRTRKEVDGGSGHGVRMPLA